MFGFDNDDPVGIDYFVQELQPWLDQHNVNYTAIKFPPLGYIRLNEYVNELARKSDARWLVFWNDDAVMETGGWDQEIMTHDGEFKLLAFHTHNDHPYSISPGLSKSASNFRCMVESTGLHVEYLGTNSS
jgi:hypothetical protein